MSSSDLPKLWTTSSKIAKFVLSKSFFSIKNQLNLSGFFFCEEYLTRRSTFINKSLTFKVICFLKSCPILSALFIILVSLMMTMFSEKMLISHRCIRGLIPNLIKKSWTEFTPPPPPFKSVWKKCWYNFQRMCECVLTYCVFKMIVTIKLRLLTFLRFFLYSCCKNISNIYTSILFVLWEGFKLPPRYLSMHVFTRHCHMPTFEPL